MNSFEIFTEAKSNKELVAVYTNTNATDKFSVGFVQDINEQEVLLAGIGTSGQYDGYYARTIDSIYRIQQRGNYLDKILYLYTLQQQKHQEIPKKDNNLFKRLLQYALENHLVVTIELLDSGYNDIIGFVKEINEEMVCIHKIDDYGKKDGISYTYLSALSALFCDSEDEANLKLLFKGNIGRN